MLTTGRTLWLVHVGVAVALFIAARISPAGSSQLMIANDLLACTGAVLVLRRPAAGVTLAAVAFSAVNLYPELWSVAQLSFALTIFGITTRHPRVGAATALGSAVVMGISGSTRHLIEFVFDVALLLALWGAGTAIHQWRRRAERAETRTTELRAQLARDLHDSVAASQSRIVARAEQTLEDPNLSPESRAALTNVIEEAERANLEMHGLLAQLRDSDQSHATPGPAAPLPDELSRQSERLRAAGFDPLLVLDDTPLEDLSPSLGWVLVESATNIIKHGIPGPCTISIQTDGGITTLRVSNRPSHAFTVQGARGFGLIGITERMMAAGGGATWGEVGDLWVLDAFMPSLPAN